MARVCAHAHTAGKAWQDWGRVSSFHVTFSASIHPYRNQEREAISISNEKKIYLILEKQNAAEKIVT